MFSSNLPEWAQWGCCGCVSRRLPAGWWRSLWCPYSEPGPASAAGACGAAAAAEWTHWHPAPTDAASPCSSICCGTTPSLREGGNAHMEITCCTALCWPHQGGLSHGCVQSVARSERRLPWLNATSPKSVFCFDSDPYWQNMTYCAFIWNLGRKIPLAKFFNSLTSTEGTQKASWLS